MLEEERRRKKEQGQFTCHEGMRQTPTRCKTKEKGAKE
jgi:hypothetical protein